MTTLSLVSAVKYVYDVIFNTSKVITVVCSILFLSAFSLYGTDYSCGDDINSMLEKSDKVTFYDGVEYRDKYENLKPKCQKDLKSCESIPMGMEDFTTTVLDSKKINQLIELFNLTSRLWEIRSSEIPKLKIPIGILKFYKDDNHFISVNIYKSEISTMACGKANYSASIDMGKIITILKD